MSSRFDLSAPLFRRPDGTNVFLKNLRTNASSSPEVTGQSVGNVEPITRANLEQKYRSTLPPELHAPFDQHIAQGKSYKDFDPIAAQNALNQQKTFNQEFQQRKIENEKANQPPAPEEYNADRDTLDFLRGLTSPEAKKQQAQLALDIQKQAMDYAQERGKESAKLAFQYEMMGRIPDTIMAGLAGSGRLMREGARDISNTVMRGVEALPKPNIQARAYQNPTFRYFQ